MIGFLGYNFCKDKNTIDPVPTNIKGIESTKIEKGVFDHVNISKNVTSSYNHTKPTDWDFNTILNADLNGNISGGNLDSISENVTAIKIKRRVKGDFDWTTLKIVPINKPEDLNFVVADNLALNYTDYEYAYVPIQEDVEGNYVTANVTTKFDGVFVCDVDTVYKFYAGVDYGTIDTVQQIGMFEPYGRQYPVIISNGLINYQQGSINGMVLPDDYLKTGNLDRETIVKQRNLLVQFLCNKKPKIIKDWNGNSFLCFITSNPQTTYQAGSGMGMLSVSASWAEVGKPDNKQDLYRCGMIPTED